MAYDYTRVASKIPTLLLLGCLTRLQAADAQQLGAANFQPSPEHPFGWRGDGNGRFTAAQPPVTWGRVSKAILGVCSQARKPKPDDKGAPLSDGLIRDWLIVGPVPIPAGKAAKDDFGTDEAKLFPDAGEKLGDVEWTAMTLDSAWLNFWPIYKKLSSDGKGVVAYAHANIFSPEGKPVYLNLMYSGPGKVWLNGKDLGSFNANGSHLKLAFEKGWNRLLLRVAPNTDTGWSKGVVEWHFNAALFGTEADGCDSKNIAWSTPMIDKGPGVGSPIISGEKLFVASEAGVLVCFSSKDGRVLWARASSYADAATAEERQKNPEVFTEADGLAAKINESLKAYCESPQKFAADPKSTANLAGYPKINALLQKLDHEKYQGQSGSEAGEAAPTPVTDGQHVYALYGSGVVACFDLDGNRKWTAVVGIKHNEHGYHASPCLVDGKVVIKSSQHIGAVALDAKTGAVATPIPLWKSRGLAMCSSPLAVNVGAEHLVVQSFGVMTRVKDGKILSQDYTPPYYNCFDYVSPTVEGNTVCSLVLPKTSGGTRFVFQTLPDAAAEPLIMKDKKECEYDVKAFPCWFSYDHCASPLLYQGLAYSLSVDGVLTVMDAAKGEVVYQKLLDVSPIMYHNGPIVRAGCSGSPTLGGKYIYIWDDQGSTLIIEPGRTFKQVARNRIEQLYFRYGFERNECTISNPIFVSNRMYYRGELNLYCIEETK
jgi:outer membrane protein assembly factor BamB